MKTKLREFWVEDRRLFVLATAAFAIGIAAIVGQYFVPSKQEDQVGWFGIGVVIAGGYAIGWRRGRRTRARRMAASEAPPAHKKLGARLASFVSDYGFIAGFFVAYGDTHSPHLALLRFAGAMCFVLWAFCDSYLVRSSGRNSWHLPKGFTRTIGLAMAFSIASPQSHEAQPRWLTVAALCFAGLLIASVPYAVVQWRRREDEREAQIMNRSLAFSFIVTMTVVLGFSLLETLKIGPQLHADYVIYVAGSAWFAAWFVLRRRM